MRKYLFTAVLYFVYWLLFFFLDRLLFVVYFFDKLKANSAAENFKVFVYGLWMDVSMAAYVCALPLLFYVFHLFRPLPAKAKKWLRIYTLSLVSIFVVLTVADLTIYEDWGSKISYKVVEYAIDSPKEAIAASSSSPVLSLVFIMTVFISVAVFLYKKMTTFFANGISPKPILAIAITILLIGAEITAVRGGWQLAPMNESMAYFSSKPFLNYAAVNTEWSFLNNVLKSKFSKGGTKNPYQYYPKKEADEVVRSLYQPATAPTPSILTTQHPNVVIIIMESFTADVVESLGGERGIAPNMEGLIQKSVLFTNAFASGDRTDKGTVAVLSGFPAQAINSIIKNDSKQRQLPSIAQVLAKAGYHTSFYYGGESEFVNTKSYLLSHAYSTIVDRNSFEEKDMNSKWGAYDEVVFNRQLSDMKREAQPFFSTLLTLTNHEPFELPTASHFGNNTLENKFRSTAWYADSCIGDYIRKASKEPWYQNTLFVMVADHGHLLPRNKYDINDYHRFRIPLLFFGGVIKPEWQGKKIDKIGSQTDIAATLLRQMNYPASEFMWSKDLLNENTNSFAFYNWDNGFGYATPQQVISFDNVGKTITFRRNNASKTTDDSLLECGKAYMQVAYDQYLKY